MSEDRVDEYGYNIRNELISAAKNAKDVEYRYQYDDIGNRISSYDLGTNRTYTANNLNQYTSISNSASSALSAVEFTPQFDDDGNQTLIQTATGIWQIQYNGENRPVVWQCVSTNSLTPNSSTCNSSTPPLISMSYDRMGRRVTKNDQRFVYDGYLQIANFEEATTNSQLTTLNSQLFIWDPTEPVATRPLVWNSDNCTSVYTHDGNKNVSEVIKSNGIAAAHYEYTPFGAVAKQYGDCAAVNPWRFSSEYAEDALGLIYYNYRHYAVNYGKWYARDPLFESGSLNLYLFADNNSVNRIDFRGKCPALLLVPGVWVVVDVIVKATVAAAATVIIVEAADNLYQTYKEECGKCEEAGIEKRREKRSRESEDKILSDCIETCWRLYLPSLYGDGAEFQRCLKHCRGF